MKITSRTYMIIIVIIMAILSSTTLAWFNTSYNYRTPDVLSQNAASTSILTNFPYPVNGSGMFYGNMIWAQASNIPSGGTTTTQYEYYNTSLSNIQITNSSETTEVLRETENGTGGNYNASQMWRDAGAMHVWHFNNNSGDSSASDQNLSMTVGSSLVNSKCLFGNCYNYSTAGGSTSYAVNGAYAYNGDQSYTVWAKSNVNSTSGDYDSLVYVGKGDGSANTLMLHAYPSGYGTNAIRTSFPNGTATKIVIYTTLTVGQINKWTHYAFIENFSASTCSVYIDGVLKNTTACAVTANTTREIVIGNKYSSGWSDGENWDGAIDEFRMYNKALTPDWILREYEYGKSVVGAQETQTVNPIYANSVNATSEVPAVFWNQPQNASPSILLTDNTPTFVIATNDTGTLKGMRLSTTNESFLNMADNVICGISTNTGTCTLNSSFALTYGTNTTIFIGINSSKGINTTGLDSNNNHFTVYAQLPTPPNITFVSSNPADISSTNLFTGKYNATWNITDNRWAITNWTLFHQINNTLTNDTCRVITNGTPECGYNTNGVTYTNTSTGKSILVNTRIDENELLPGTYALSDEVTDATTHSAQAFTNNDIYKTTLLNVSNNLFYGYYEIMINKTILTGSNAQVWYCNSSYTTGTISSSPNCIQFGTLPAAQSGTYNHTHTANSAHQVFPFVVNTTTGNIGSVGVTETSQFIIRASLPASGTWNAWSVPNTSRTTTTQSSTNTGTSWTSQTYTFDTHLHQFGTETAVNIYLCATNNKTSTNCSVTHVDLINLSGLPPIAPSITAPAFNASIEASSLTVITWNAATSPNGYGISYNVSIENDTNSLLQILTANTTGLTVNWNSNTTGSQHVRVTAIDDNGLTSTATRTVQVVDTTIPGVLLDLPTNGFLTNNANTNFTYNTTDNYAKILSCNLTINTTNYANASVTSGIITQQNATLNDGSYWWNVTCSDGFNTNTSTTRNLTIDTTPPSVGNTTANPASGSAYTNPNTITLTISPNDISGISQVNINFNGTTQTATPSGNNYTATFTNLHAGTYNYNWTVNDTAGNVNTTSTTNYYLINTALNPESGGGVYHLYYELLGTTSVGTYVNYTRITTASDAGISGGLVMINYTYDDATQEQVVGGNNLEAGCANKKLFNFTNPQTAKIVSTIHVYALSGSNGKQFSICDTPLAYGYNITPTQTIYVINPATPTLTMSVTPNPALTINNVTAQCNNTNTDGSANTSIYLNGTLNATGTTSVTATFNPLTIGTRQVNCTSTASENYTANNLEIDLVTNTHTPTAANQTTSPTSPFVYVSSQVFVFGIDAYDQYNVTSVVLNFNGTPRTANLTTGNTYRTNFTSLGAGAYSYNWTVTDTYGYTNTTSNAAYTVTQATPTLSLTVAPNPALISEIISASCTNTNTDGSIVTNILLNGTLNKTGSTPVTTTFDYLTAGTYQVNCTSNTTTNYTATNTFTNLVVSDNIILRVTNTYTGNYLTTWNATINSTNPASATTYNTTLLGNTITLPYPIGTILYNVTFAPRCSLGDVTSSCGFFTTTTPVINTTTYANTTANQTLITIRAINQVTGAQINDRTFTYTESTRTGTFVGNTTLSLEPGVQHNFTITTPLVNNKYLNTTATLYEIANRNILYTFTTDAQYQIDNCSTLTIQAMNFTVRDTNTSAVIPNATLAAYAQVWIDTPTGYKNFNLTWPKSDESTFGICINSSQVLSAYAQMEYGSTGYTTRTYYLTNNTLTNITNFVNLYLDSAATSVLITVIDQNAQPIQDAFIYVLAYDLPTNSFTTDSVVKTGTDGTVIANVQLLTQWYKLMGTKTGYVTKTLEPFVFTTTTKLFIMELETAQPISVEAPASISCSMAFDNSTRAFTLSYLDSTGNSNTACIKAYKQNLMTNTLVNQTCQNSSGVDIVVGIPASTGVGSWLAQSVIQSGGREYQCGTPITYTDDDGYKVYGKTGLVATFLLVLGLSLVGIWSLPTAALFAVIGILVSWFLGIYQISLTMAVFLLIVGGIIVYKVQLK